MNPFISKFSSFFIPGTGFWMMRPIWLFLYLIFGTFSSPRYHLESCSLVQSWKYGYPDHFMVLKHFSIFQAKMNYWDIIDKSSSPEEFAAIVHHNEGVSNFSVKISNILQNNAFSGVPNFLSVLRYPYVCVYFDNSVLVFSDTKCEIVKLHKTFDSPISGLIIQKNADVLVVILESSVLHTVDLLSSKAACSPGRITHEKFSKISIYEQENGSFILASNSLMYHCLTILPRNDGSNGIQFKLSRMKYSELNEEIALETELAAKNVNSINASTVCVKSTAENGILAICPITDQETLLTESIQAKCIVPFKNTDRFLFLKESSVKHELCIADFFMFRVEFNIPVSEHCYVIGGLKDSAIYLDIKDKKIYVYQIQENSPLSQLEILIAARNYEGAEAFAKLNNLSPAAVLQLKAKCLLSNLKKLFSSEHLQELKEILSTCDSADFVLNCCLEGAEADINLSVLLEFAKKYLKSVNDHALKEKFNGLIWKSEVFKLIQLEDVDNLLEWSDLTKQSALALLLKLLSDDQLDLACLVWVKCYPDLIHQLTQQNVTELLYSVSPDMKLNTVLRWLEYFIPNIINIRPFSTDLIINWAQERIISLEKSKHWPEIGVQLAEKLSPLIFDSNAIVTFMSVEAEKFYFLLHCLKNIQTLKKSYNIIVSLKDFMVLGKEELAKLILRKAFAEDLGSLLSDYLEAYEMRNNINRDNLIKEHIEELISVSPIVDENKMEILLQHMNNVEEKLQCVLLFLKSAPIPWSAKVSKIAHSAKEADHQLSKAVCMEIVHAEVKSVLMKYKCHELVCEDYEILIRRIIKKGEPGMLADIEKITSVYPSLQEDAYLLCIQKYLQSSQINLAIKLYNQMEDTFKILCVNSVLLKLENLLYSNTINEKNEINHIDFLKSVYIKEENIVLDHLHSIYVLKNKLNFKISLSEYSIGDCRLHFFKKWCKHVSKQIDGKGDNVREILITSIRIGSCLKLRKAESILNLIREVDSKTQSALVNLIFDSKTCMLDEDLKSVEIIVEIIRHIDCNNLNFVGKALKLILRILQNCNYMYLSSDLINVCSWIMAIYYSHNNCKELLSTWKICSFYNPHIISSIIPLWSELMSKSVSIGSNEKLSVCVCKSDACNDGSVCLKQTLIQLQSQQNDIHFSRILAYYTMYRLQNNYNCPVWLSELSDSFIKVLVSKMIAFKQPDHLNISILMFCHSSLEEWLSELLTGFADTHRKMNVALYVLQCKEMFQHVNIPYKQAFNVYSQNNIASKLEKYGISFTEYTQENTICNVNALLESLVNVDLFNFLTLEEFCMVTGISLDQALMFYLFSLFKSWNTNYEIITDNFGDKCVYVEPTKADLLQKCLTIIERIQRKDDLIVNLTTLFNNGEIKFQNLTTITLCQYSYEVFLLIIKLLKHVSSDQMFWKEFVLLKFLQTYRRVSKPKQTELDVYSMKEAFPEIGYYRLPFQSLISADCWTNLKTELTLGTYERWLPVAGLLPLDVEMQVRYDMICSSAVRESMTHRKSLNESVGFKWSLNLQNGLLLKQAHKCIQHITNLEWAGACFYYVYQGSIVGADQVAAANMCYQFAEHWSKIQPNNVLKKMQSKHLLTLTAHILHKVGLAEEKLLSLCDNPQRLIEALYNHESILTHTECPNIHAAVDDIAESNGLNSSTIRMNILERILNQSKSQHSHNGSTSTHGKTKSIDDGTLSKETLMKACYILKGTNPMLAAFYLSRIGLDESESLENYNNRIRALQCLLSLADCDVVEKVTNFTVPGLWSKLWELYFINCLCSIGLEFLTATFLQNKLQALQQIWNAREHNQAAVSLVIKVLFVYHLQLEDNLLDEITKEIIKFGMISDLKEFLFSTKSFYSKSYIEAWSNVLINPFKQLDAPLAGNQKEECYNTLKLLPTCPVTLQVDLTPIWYNCLKLGAYDMASVILPHVAESDRRKIVAKFGKIKPSLLSDIKSLKSKGILTTNISLAILKENYETSRSAK